MQLTLEIPDQYLQGKNQLETTQQIKLYAALLMFQSGQLSRGAACEFADGVQAVSGWCDGYVCRSYRSGYVEFLDKYSGNKKPAKPDSLRVSYFRTF